MSNKTKYYGLNRGKYNDWILLKNQEELDLQYAHGMLKTITLFEDGCQTIKGIGIY